MWLLHNIGESPSREPHVRANYNTREQIERIEGRLSFDGVYENVWYNRDLLKGREVTLFIMGNYIGMDNTFDAGMPFERYCDWDQIMDLVKQGAKLGWHTKTHRDLTTLDEIEIEDEVKPPFPMEYFAYPYGRYNQTVVDIVKKYYKKAYSVDETNNNEYTLPRWYVR